MRGVTHWRELFTESVAFEPAGDVEAFLKHVPAKWVVYLFVDADDLPVQLLCVKNLRASLKRRLSGQDVMAGPSRRVDYRDLVRRIYWRRVDSAFEADLVYLEAARAIFPQSYRGMLGFDPAWFVHANPDHPFPKLTKTIDLLKAGELIGPVQDKHAAQKLIELMEDAFDLCRYHNILTLAPHGRACAYKEMGKCPAPCDGSISIEQYRRMIAWAIETAVAPANLLEQTHQRMTDAARDLNFEAAGKIKQYAHQLKEFGSGAFKHVRRIEDFRYIVLQQGGRSGTAKVFVVTPGQVSEVAGLIAEPSRGSSDLLRWILSIGAQPGDLTEAGAERIGVVADHLFRAKKTSGVFIALTELEDRALAKAWKELAKQKSQAGEEGDESEGVVKELQRV